MSAFLVRDELASRLYERRLCLPGNEREQGGRDGGRSDLSRLALQCLEEAQAFCEAVCHERGHKMSLQEWLPGQVAAMPGRSSGAPLGLFQCERCGYEEKRASP